MWVGGLNIQYILLENRYRTVGDSAEAEMVNPRF